MSYFATKMKIKSLLSFASLLFSASLLIAAPYAPGSRKPLPAAWVPNTAGGTGVTGGIPTRTVGVTLYPSGNTDDRAADIYAAVAAAGSGQAIRLSAGTYYVSGLNLGTSLNNKTIKGDGGESTRIILTGPSGFSVRGAEFYGAEYSPGDYGNVVSGVSRGSTTVVVDNAATFTVGRMIRFTVRNDNTLPTMSVQGYDLLKGQNVICTAVNTATNQVTFSPALYQNYTTYVGGTPLQMKWALTNRNIPEVSYAGVEDIFIEVAAATPQKVFQLIGATNSWLKGITIRNIQNYGISIGDSAKVQVLGCRLDTMKGNWISPNHAGLEMGACSAMLIENNTINRCFPAFEIQGSYFSGSVVAYNFFYDSGSNEAGYPYVNFNASHGAGTFGNLYEGNVAPGIVFDSYFGGSDAETIYRNMFHATGPKSVEAAFSFVAGRFSRDHEFVGNVNGDIRFVGGNDGVALGNASAFGAGNLGEANNLAGDPQVDLLLTGTVTRISDSLATVLLPSLGQMELNQWPITMTWEAQTVGGTPVLEGRRNWLHVLGLNQSTLVATVGDGPGNNQTTLIPPTGTTVRLWTGANGYRELDLAVAATTLRLGNNYVFHGGIPSAEALGTTTLPNSLYLASAPSFLSGYTFPPFNPTAATPNRSFSAIPAGALWVNTEPSRIISAYVTPLGNRLKLTMSEATPVGAGGGDGLSFASNPSGGAVTLTFNAGESTSTEKVYTSSRTIYDNETLPELIYMQPGNGLEDASGNDVYSTWGIQVNSLSDATTGGEWISSAAVADVTGGTVTYGAYKAYRSRVTLATGRSINRFRIYTTGHLYDANEQIAVHNSAGVLVARGTATASASLTPHYIYGNLPETYLPAGNYWLSIHHTSNGGSQELQLPYKTGTGIGVGWFTENPPLWPATITGNLNLATTVYDNNGGFAFAIRALDDGSVVFAPQFSPSPGTYASAQTVTITSGTPPTVTFYYTIDGSDPTPSSTLYTGPVLLPGTTTVLKAIGVKAGLATSSVTSGTYTISAPPTAPAAPTALVANAASSTQINLTWTDNSSNETGFRIERKIGAGTWGAITTVAVNVTNYSNIELTPATTYDYRVYAVNGVGDSTVSNTATATTPAGGGGGGPSGTATIGTLNINTMNIQ
jgi:hypothetical protein